MLLFKADVDGGVLLCVCIGVQLCPSAERPVETRLGLLPSVSSSHFRRAVHLIALCNSLLPRGNSHGETAN